MKKITPPVKEGSFSDSMSREFALYEIERFRLLLEAGDRGALLKALAECAKQDLPMPDWLVVAYLRAYRAGIHLKVGSWDDVFGPPAKKGTHLERERLRRTRRIEVFNLVSEIRREDAGVAIDVAFERVGDELSISAPQARRLYYEAKSRSQEWMLHPIIQALLEPYVVKPPRED